MGFNVDTVSTLMSLKVSGSGYLNIDTGLVVFLCESFVISTIVTCQVNRLLCVIISFLPLILRKKGIGQCLGPLELFTFVYSAACSIFFSNAINQRPLCVNIDY